MSSGIDHANNPELRYFQKNLKPHKTQTITRTVVAESPARWAAPHQDLITTYLLIFFLLLDNTSKLFVRSCI